MTKKGFTLIELMVVIAIVGILAVIASNFDFNKKTDIEKRDRFVAKIGSIIHSTLLSTSSGKGIKSNTNIINPTSTHIQFSTSSIGVYYYSGATVVGTWEVMNIPFFGETGYTLTGTYWKDKDTTTTGSGSLPIDIIFDNNGSISFTGGISETGVILGMGIGFHSSLKNIEFDRRFGKITVSP